MIDPTSEELGQISTINDACDLGGLTGEPKDSFLAHMSMNGQESTRLLAVFSDGDWNAMMAPWTVADAPAAPAHWGQVGLVRRVCLIKAGVILTARATHELQAAATAAAATVQTNPATPGPDAQDRAQATTAVLATPRVKMNLVINQLFDSEVPALDATKIATAYNVYKDRMGTRPSPDEECTSEQLTAFHTVIAGGYPPYVDMSVWGPYGNRLYRRLKMTGMQVMPAGSLKQVEILGPPTFELWQASWRPFR